jgi:hypothetical protein
MRDVCAINRATGHNNSKAAGLALVAPKASSQGELPWPLVKTTMHIKHIIDALLNT